MDGACRPSVREDLDRPALARLAPTILRCAEEGDRVAVDVVRSAADGLAGQVAAVTRRLGIDGEDALSYAGGLLTGSSVLRAHVEEALSYREYACDYAQPVCPLF